MPIIRPFSTLYPRLFPAGYSGSQVLRSAVIDGPEQRLYQAGDYGLAGYKNLQSSVTGYAVFHGLGSLYSSISGHNPSNLSAAVSAVRCQAISPKRYVIGYEDGEPQFLETRQQFRCVSFVSAYLKSTIETSKNLSAAVKVIYSGYDDLSAELTGFPSTFGGNRGLAAVIKSYASVYNSLSASVVGSYCQTLLPIRYIVGYESGIPKFIEGRQQFRCVSFLPGYISIISRSSGSLPATVRGWVSSYSDLGIYMIKGIYSGSENLPTVVRPHVYTSGSLHVSVFGSYCQTLSPKRYVIGYEEGTPQFLETRQQFRCVDFIPAYVSAVISTSTDLPALTRGWVSSYKDLGADIISGRTWFAENLCLAAAINAWAVASEKNLSVDIIGSYCQALLPRKYIIGYENGVPKFIDGRQRFRCVTFLPAYIKRNFRVDLGAWVFLRERVNVDLPAYLNAVWKQGSLDLKGLIRGWVYEAPKDLPVYIWGCEVRDMPAIIGVHAPGDLPARLRVFSQVAEDLPANIYGWAIKDLLATLTGMIAYDLPVYVYSIPSKDLQAYLKVWPQEDLPANLYGWDSKDLGAVIDWNIGKDLPATIGGHPWKNLGIILRGWARRVPTDLLAYIRGFTYEDMQAMIRATYLEDLLAYLYSIPPRDIQATIHGWDTKDLLAILIGGYGPHDIQAYINVYNRPVDLPGRIIGRRGIEIPSNLPVVVSSWGSGDLRFDINAIPSINLGAYLAPSGTSTLLPAYIYPKMLNLTTIVSIGTMEHLDLYAVINLCGGSGFKNLNSFIRCMYLKDLGASIEGKVYPNYTADLAAKIGYADTYINVDKLPVTISIDSGYITEDKLPLFINIHALQANLKSYITATPRYTDLGVSLRGVWLREHEFENYKHKEMVYDLHRTGRLNWNEVVEILFESIVDDYFYIEANQTVHRTDKYARWLLEINSYVPENTELGIKRKLHRMKKLHNLTKFASIDEAMRFAINYVTEYNYGNIRGTINITGGFSNLSSYINPDYFTTTNSDLSSSITVQEKSFILSFDDEIEIH